MKKKLLTNRFAGLPSLELNVGDGALGGGFDGGLVGQTCAHGLSGDVGVLDVTEINVFKL